MSSSWPILVGMFAVVFAAFWYDAAVAAPQPPAQQVLGEGSVR
jgi:hypothetical protein